MLMGISVREMGKKSDLHRISIQILTFVCEVILYLWEYSFDMGRTFFI